MGKNYGQGCIESFSGMGVSKKQIVKAMLKYIPEDFKGRLLDVPAGTGLFTYRKYSWMRDARIICYDEDRGNA